MCRQVVAGRGGWTTKVHALTDEAGRPIALCLTPGQAHDLTGIAELLTRIPTPRRPLADRAYDARRLAIPCSTARSINPRPVGTAFPASGAGTQIRQWPPLSIDSRFHFSRASA
ncbi:transposase [Sedimentitalea xiamensis]|uniref:transposase n=1 Tax=Sedimentitalea xiamensis TaxID=3050037 RepID=UPI0038999CCF